MTTPHEADDQFVILVLRTAALDDWRRITHDLFCPVDGCRPRALEALAVCAWTEDEYLSVLRGISEARHGL